MDDPHLAVSEDHRALERLISHDFGRSPIPVPEPFADLLDYVRAGRPNRPSDTPPASDWLFPGRQAGQPMDPTTLGMRLSAAGIPTLQGRTAALRQLVLQAPPSIVAGMLGYHSVHTQAVATQTGGTWKTYAPGDHTR
jgi:hypothetical protein